METPRSDRWELTAPESQVLLTGPETPNLWAIRIAFKELVARGILSTVVNEQRWWLILRRKVDYFTRAAYAQADVDPPLAHLISVLPSDSGKIAGSQGFPIDQATTDVMRWYRLAGGYVRAEVLPSLRERGLFTTRKRGFDDEWILTPLGETRLAELREFVETGRQLLDSDQELDREGLVSFIEWGGPAVLLIDEIDPTLRERGRQLFPDDNSSRNLTGRQQIPPFAFFWFGIAGDDSGRIDQGADEANDDFMDGDGE